ncbi:hypothetical protein N4G70_30360 [Streptomyces sp. ASQP_92]|uniref:hypothetical protein n=1 Tax=Streptomyces sp. ASQP_92 TaxID=2979116 RepID=UPI0021C022D9|nr:hypothetical protein [Streptomyces sp. ASQP_92]MCT9093136.1 hypothetical protein [Streptomyces sp. ASQP_92]
MRKILLTSAATACLALTACGPGGGSDHRPSTAASTPSGSSSSGSATPGPGAGGGQSALEFGVPARTVGAKLVGILEITPTSVVHVGRANGTASRFGTFVVVTTKDASLTANAADEEPANGTKGGWRWIAANGQSVAENNGSASRVSVTGYEGAGRIEPGTSQPRSEVFDLTPEQAGPGATLVYTDATGSENRWKVPAADSGPEAADVKRRLAS